MTLAAPEAGGWVDRLVALGADVSLKALLLWLAAAAAACLLGRRRALERSCIWTAALVAWALLPAFVTAMPRLRVSCLPGEPPTMRSDPSVETAETVGAETPWLLETAAAFYEDAIARPRSVEPVPRKPARSIATSADRCAAPAAVAAPRVPVSSWETPSWKTIALGVYAAGVAFFLARLLVAAEISRRLRRSGFPLTHPAWARVVEAWRSRLGVHGSVEVYCTRSVEVPLVLGWLRPKILLPPGIVRPGSRKLRDSILAHELAHVRRTDGLWLLVSHVLRAIYWFHPLAWLTARSLDRAREEACDDVSVFLLRSGRRYRAALLKVARLLVRRPALSLGVAMARSTELERRIARIDRGCRAPACIPSWRVRAVVAPGLALVLGFAGALELTRLPSFADEGLPSAGLPVRVIHAAKGEPLEGVRISASPIGERVDRPDVFTDARGAAVLPSSAAAGWERTIVRLRKDGFVPLRCEWRERSSEVFSQPREVRLEPAASIGGRIVDEDGKAVGGAEVRIQAQQRAEEEFADFLDEPFVTDADGRWRCESAPSDTGPLRIRVLHPQFRSEPATQRPSEKIRDGTDVWTLHPGLPVEGKVIDAAGRPVAGASVREGVTLFRRLDGVHVGGGNVVATGPDGVFRFRCAAPGELQITVQAAGFSPALQRVDVKADLAPLEVWLEPGRVLKGRVLGPDGKPIEGALVEAGSWHRAATLDWKAQTDSSGRFEWKDAPEDTVFLRVYKPGFASNDPHEATASQGENVISLTPMTRVHGRVVDAASGRPVARFHVLTGWLAGDGPRWNGRSAEMAGGAYDVLIQTPRTGNLVRIEADGYLPAASQPFARDAGLQQLDFRLARGANEAGSVMDSDGKPAAGAVVAVFLPSKPLRLVDGALEQDADRAAARADAGGRFSLSPQGEEHGILVLHERGFALIPGATRADLTRIALSPWGRVEGELRPGGRALAGEEVMISGEPVPGQVRSESRVTTDAGGRFSFPRELPGRFQVSHQTNIAPLSRRPILESTRETAVEVASGTTVRVVLGGEGRAVTGRMARAPGSTGEPDWRAGHVHLRRPDPALPHGGTMFSSPLQADGSFRIEDVPSGNLQLTVRLHDRKHIERGTVGEEMGLFTKDVEVPPAASGAPPLDLGALEMIVYRSLEVGRPAPCFSVKTLDGKDVRLEDYRGKIVLLEFWATWCGPCRAQAPALKQLHEDLARDSRFAILGLSLDEDIEAVREYTRAEKIPWTQGLLGEWNASAVRAEYGVAAVPSLCLVGRDGNVLAKGLMAPIGVKQFVTEALLKETKP